MTGKIDISLTNDQGLTHDVSLATTTGSIWKVYNGETYVYDEALQRTGQLTYSYVASGFQETMTVSAIDPLGQTFTAVTSAGNTYRWNQTLGRLENINPSSDWNWRPQRPDGPSAEPTSHPAGLCGSRHQPEPEVARVHQSPAAP